MTKVKVATGVSAALEHLLFCRGISRETILEIHASGGAPWTDLKHMALNDLSLIQLAEILINGYEVELTPQEKALVEIKELTKRINSNNNQTMIQGWALKLGGMIEMYELLTGERVDLND